MTCFKYGLMTIAAVIVLSGCSRFTEVQPAADAQKDPAFQKVWDMCEQEALGRCWKPIASTPLGLTGLWESHKQKTCKQELISNCLKRYGYHSESH